ncbi:MAG: maltose alpha-D-glucosyltransferase [Candidatus Omnitrophota bacterium]
MVDDNREIPGQPVWYKDAIIYQLHVKTFYDSKDDGIGDFLGLTRKLDYLKNLGISAVWLLPFYPSPLRDDGYDIADYYSVHPHYGTLKDFKVFLKEAHAHGLKVITELVINHTSDQHPWFQRARKAKEGSDHRNYYVWSKTQDLYQDARIIFKDFEQSNWAWDEQAQAYYWHRFYSHQPDLNFDNPSVQKEIMKVADFWFELGVDGLRLDAVPYLFERQGTNCENLPETHAFLQKFRAHIDGKFKDRMLLAEANQWPEDAAAYFGKGDECQMAFHFPLMPRIYMGVQMEDRFPIVDILEQTPSIPSNCQWAIFLRNHDELTLEMVTDEERDYMYRAYAKDAQSRINLGIRRRLAPLLSNNRRKIEVMNILLLSLPGTPVIYYGDEIGMGDNRFLGDRNGMRTPMQWSPDRNAGFSRANAQELYLPVIIDSEYHYETVNVETQDNNLSSMLWWMRRVLAMRKRYRAFSQGTIKFLFPDNAKVLCFIRSYNDESVLVVINLSRYSQPVELDLPEYRDFVPQELFSHNNFPPIKDTPYVLTLGPHSHFWFSLKRPKASILEHESTPICVKSQWDEVLTGEVVHYLEMEILPHYLEGCRWFSGKSRTIRSVRISDVMSVHQGGARISVVNVQYTSGAPEGYLLPLSFLSTKDDQQIVKDFPQSVICRLQVGSQEGVLIDGAFDSKFHAQLFLMIANRRQVSCGDTLLQGYSGRGLKSVSGNYLEAPASRVLKADQSNTAIIFGDAFFMKLFRKIEEGVNPDAEIIRYLSEERKYDYTPVFAGQVKYMRPKAEPTAICVLQSYVHSQSDAWNYTVDQIKLYFDQILSRIQDTDPSPLASLALIDMKMVIDPFYIEMVKRLAFRTAQMHQQLAVNTPDPNFKPETFSMLYQRSIYQNMGSRARLTLRTLRKYCEKLSPELQGEAVPVLEAEREIYDWFKTILSTKFTGKTIRIHGDFHLGQVLFTGKDFMIIDFEGEPARSLSERRLKRSALRDVAGMLRSFHYASYATLFMNRTVREADVSLLEAAADRWNHHVGGVFLNAYFDAVGDAEFLPKDRREVDVLLRSFLLDKAIYELYYELNNRPDWMVIPLRGIRHILKTFSIQG